MAYRPQANGTAERMVQTLTRSLKIYVADVNQQDWDEYAERLTFAINTAQDRIRAGTSFFLIHRWDLISTLEATISVGNTGSRPKEVKIQHPKTISASPICSERSLASRNPGNGGWTK